LCSAVSFFFFAVAVDSSAMSIFCCSTILNSIHILAK
jgi:hypothetical protein